MNALAKIRSSRDVARIAHSIMAYDRATEEPRLELPIPLFLDTLALKVAGVPPDDKYGALSYELEPPALGAFQFLLGLEVDLEKSDYFIESTLSRATGFSPRKLEAVDLLTQVTPRPQYARTGEPRISERELIFPTLRLLGEADNGWMDTGELTVRLTKLFTPSGKDAMLLSGRKDTYFSQKVRNMISHKDQPSSFINRGLADHERSGLRITDQGRSAVDALLG